MSRRKVIDKKVSFAAALRNSLARNIRIQAKLRGESPSQYVEAILKEGIKKTYEFVRDDEIFGLPFLKGRKDEVLAIWVNQLRKEKLSFDGEILTYKGRTLKVEDLGKAMDKEEDLSLRELLYNFIYPEGLEKGGLITKDDIESEIKALGIEGVYEIVTDPRGDFFFIVPDRKCNLKKVVEIDRHSEISKLKELIGENVKAVEEE